MPRAATDKQLAVLRYIAHETDKNGYSPTVREVGAEFGFSSLRGVTVHLDALERKGLLMRASSIARTMQVTSAGRQALGMAAEPADRYKALLAAVERYRCLRRRYE
jgi:SOS-response transcriptional repressor LexA